jgi:hypothetical protein
MKSKVQFDIDQTGNPVVSMRVEVTDDVRDKLAKRFIEKLGHDSALAVISFRPDPIEGVSDAVINPVPPVDIFSTNDEIRKLLYYVGKNQMTRMIKLMDEELITREVLSPEPHAKLPAHEFYFLLQNSEHKILLALSKGGNKETEYWFKDNIVSEDSFKKIVDKISKIKI